ncbi:FprA family A-type flavoprotein [Pleomorphomonas koreensis]|uniref:FprA family A-type flavoprotein n=1 Tax=Pleomorphomonas koreensis TaxID=257440 RepID=UPI0003F8B5F2|nr:FprA family A-type flavoprotein [Pleomorphomonas koreensis]
MIPFKVTDGIDCFRAIDWDRELFDELVPLPEGTTYNAYLVTGSDKTALIDTVYPPKTDEFIAALRRAGVRRIDYIVANHAEQDHSGSIPAVLELFPDARVVTNAKCKRFIMDTLPVARDAFITVGEGHSLPLGGRTLQFLMTPWVHWPDTMTTCVPEAKIAFTCDFLGAHLATTEAFADDEARVETAAKRYYAEIMMPYRGFSREAVDKVGALDLDFIAPSHGPVYARPSFILDLYRAWTADEPKPYVVIPYVSMYESTARMVAYLTDRLIERGLGVRPINVVGLDTGDYAMSLVDASTIVFASPTVLSGPHPDVAYAALLANVLNPKAKYAAVVGSFGWEGNLPEIVRDMLPKLGARFFEPVMVKGLPREAAFADLDRLADDIAAAHAAG